PRRELTHRRAECAWKRAVDALARLAAGRVASRQMAAPRFGVNIVTSAGDGADPVGDARRAEELGFDFVSSSDHPGASSANFETWTMLTWIAASTSRIGLWSEPRFTHQGRRYSTEKAELEPKPSRRIPIWLGTFAPRGLAVTGRLADGWIPSLGYAPPDEVVGMRERVLDAARKAGRDP